jgi:hypothetical protein
VEFLDGGKYGVEAIAGELAVTDDFRLKNDRAAV